MKYLKSEGLWTQSISIKNLIIEDQMLEKEIWPLHIYDLQEAWANSVVTPDARDKHFIVTEGVSMPDPPCFSYQAVAGLSPSDCCELGVLRLGHVQSFLQGWADDFGYLGDLLKVSFSSAKNSSGNI